MSDAKEWYGVYLKCHNYEVVCCRMKNRKANLNIAWKELVKILTEFGYPIPNSLHKWEIFGGELKYFNPKNL